MPMPHEEFDALVARLEEYARKEPRGYRLRVGLLAGLGYAYILVVLVLLIGLIFGLGWVMIQGRAFGWLAKIGWVLVTLAVIILRALWVRFDAPEGLTLTAAQAPRLHTMVEELRARLQAPPFHRILLTDDFNAAVAQVPRLGILGWQTNYLLLGLPLMQALSPEQFRAVIAHELGHLSGNHSRFGGWIYRIRQTWDQLWHRLQEQGHGGAVVFEWFLNWYVPYFQAYSFALARADEYVADRCAAELAGPKNAAEALIQLNLKGRFLQQSFWPEIYKQVDRQAEPPAALFTSMLPALRTRVPSEDAGLWLDQALAEKTSTADTHPCLSERLAALEYRLPTVEAERAAAAPQLFDELEETAAQHYCGPAVAELAAQLDLAWKQTVAPEWRERHTYAQESQKKLQELEEKARLQPLSEEEAWQQAQLTAEFRAPEAAIPLLQEILVANPEHLPARYALGQLLLGQDEEAGIQHIETAMAGDPDAVLPGTQSIYLFLKKQGRDEEADRYRSRAEQHYELVLQSQQERAGLSESDRFEPHALSPEVVAQLREQLAGVPHVGAAHLARKVVTLFPEKPLYVLAVATQHAWYKFRSETQDAELAQQITQQLQLPGETLVVVLNQHTAGIGKRVRKVPGTEIYRR